jgi:hypothetical protein
MPSSNTTPSAHEAAPQLDLVALLLVKGATRAAKARAAKATRAQTRIKKVDTECQLSATTLPDSLTIAGLTKARTVGRSGACAVQTALFEAEGLD